MGAPRAGRSSGRPPARPQHYTLERRQLVPRPLAETFAFYAEPRNLARITPPWLGFRMASDGDLTMREGLQIEYRIRALGVPQRWTSEITLWQPPFRFVDEQRRGPYAFWHHIHEFEPAADGNATEIRDRVTYSLPLGILGRIANALVVRQQLVAIFDYRERKVKEIFANAGTV